MIKRFIRYIIYIYINSMTHYPPEIKDQKRKEILNKLNIPSE